MNNNFNNITKHNNNNDEDEQPTMISTYHLSIAIDAALFNMIKKSDFLCMVFCIIDGLLCHCWRQCSLDVDEVLHIL